MGTLGEGGRARERGARRVWRTLNAVAALVMTAAALGACAPDADTALSDETGSASEVVTPTLIDTAIAPAVAGADGWNYHQTMEADVTGDGRPERVTMMARVELYRGQPAWDDGQPWQVYIEQADSARTYVYAQRLQLGTLTMRIAQDGPGGRAAIVLLEQLPHQMSVYEAFYESPDSLTVATRFQRSLDPRGPLAAPALP